MYQSAKHTVILFLFSTVFKAVIVPVLSPYNALCLLKLPIIAWPNWL